MRKLLLFLIAAMPFLTIAQPGVGTFESLPLPTADTYYVNYSAPGIDVGFVHNITHFPCVYDTSFGAHFLSSGFVYSNKRDSLTSGFKNQFSARPGHGNNNSLKYLVSYGETNIIRPTNSKWGWGIVQFYITNTTYAYNSMRDGDAFAKKFGGSTGNDSDWFKLTIRGYNNGSLIADSQEFYLADFRFANNAQDYIVKDWRQVSLKNAFTHADSLKFTLSSSDAGSFGMNTPAYFAMDDLTVVVEDVANIPFSQIAGIAPNPANDFLYLDIKDASVNEAFIIDVTGRLIADIPVKSSRVLINTSAVPSGQYILKLVSKEGSAVTKFIRQ